MPYTCDDIHELESLLNSKQDQLAIYQLELEDLQADLADLQEDLTVARNLLSQFEDNLVNQKTLLNEKIVEKQRTELQIIQIRQYIAFLELKLLNLQNEKLDLLAYVQTQPQVITAWCADYTLNLTGEVGIADVPGAAGLDFQGVTYYSPAVVRQIRPGFSGRASYNSARDGILQHAKASAPANHFLQAVRHSAVQKWKPQYRYGKITSIMYDNDTCSVALERAYDKYMFNGYNVNQASELSGIPIEYMDCNAKPFVIGDDVIVEWISGVPKVIGYKELPQPCGNFQFLYIICSAYPAYYYDVNEGENIHVGDYVDRCIIWDIKTNQKATDIPLNDGSGFAVFPCDPALISNFLSNDSRFGGNSFLSWSTFGGADFWEPHNMGDHGYPLSSCPDFAIDPFECWSKSYSGVDNMVYVNEGYQSYSQFVGVDLPDYCYGVPAWNHVTFLYSTSSMRLSAVLGNFGRLTDNTIITDTFDSRKISSSRGLSDGVRGFIFSHERMYSGHSIQPDPDECHLSLVYDSGYLHRYKMKTPFGTEFNYQPIDGAGSSTIYYTTYNWQMMMNGLTDESMFWVVWMHGEPFSTNLPNEGLFVFANCHFSVDENDRGNISSTITDIWAQARNTAFESALKELYWSVAENENTGWAYKNIYPDPHNSKTLPIYEVTGNLMMRFDK